MKTIIFYDGCFFPLSFVTGAIFTGKLPEIYTPEMIWDIIPVLAFKKHKNDQIYYLGQAHDGTRVLSFSALSGRLIMKNLIPSFLNAHGINENDFRIIEINTGFDFYFWIGQSLLRISPYTGIGKKMVENYLMRIYPDLVNFVKLDWHSQIADNYTQDHILSKIIEPNSQKGF